MADSTHFDFDLEPKLGDERLNRRLKKIVDQLAKHPSDSVPQSQESWANTKAAYRFWDNKAVSPQAILAASFAPTIARISTLKDVLAIQDTSTFCYARHPKTMGLGYINNEKGHGIHVHSTLAATCGGVPLGLLDQRVWVRETLKQDCKEDISSAPIETKESYRWIQALNDSTSLIPFTTHVITVADRESDFYDLFQQPRRENTDLLLRGKNLRRLVLGSDHRNLKSALQALPVAGRLEVHVARGHEHRDRDATVEIKFGKISLKPPRNQSGWFSITPVTLRVIEVKEIGEPATEEEPIYWVLFTTMPLATFEDACRCVRYYTYRWLIERYHYVLKSGCHLEELQLETRERLERTLATYCIVAWRLLYLRYADRNPDQQAPASVALSQNEWRALFCFHNKTSHPPQSPPPLQEAILWIAQLGGFLARQHDGHPGVKVIWRGLRRLEDIAETYEIFSRDLGNA